MIEQIETNPKVPKFKVNDTVRITKYKYNFSKGNTENCSREIFIIDSVLETNPWTYVAGFCLQSLLRNKHFLMYIFKTPILRTPFSLKNMWFLLKWCS